MERIAPLRLISTVLVALSLSLAFAVAQEPSRWFEVETVNAGLPPAPEGLDRSTPQGSMESFLEASRAEDYPLAAQMLDLSGIDPADQPELGPALARMLAEVIERRYWIDWDELPDRPDALLQGASDRVPLAGEPRRSLRLTIFDLGDRPVPLRLNRLKPASGDPVWVFAQQSVANIPELHALYGPGWFERRLSEAWRAESWFERERHEQVTLRHGKGFQRFVA